MTPTGWRVIKARWFPRDDYLRWALVADAVGHFPDWEAADADRERRERAAWLDPAFNPFGYAGPLWYLTGLPDWALRDWVQDRGLVPPQKQRTWRRWYETKRPDPLLMREALGKLTLFAVEPAWPPAWGAGELLHYLHWEDPRPADPEGHHIRHVYPTRAGADAHGAFVSESLLANSPHLHEVRYSTLARDGRAETTAAADTTFFEAVPLDCPAGVPGPGPAFLVVRRPFDDMSVYDTRLSENDTGAGVPLGLFPTRGPAAARVAELFRLAWRTVNPFAFFHVHWFAGDVLERVRRAWPDAPDQSRGDPDRAASWDAAQPGLDDTARAAVWAEVDGRPLFEVQAVHWHAE